MIHRDVKPGNLLVSDSDSVKLADFGIARATDQSSITQVGSVLGTAAYLAPEQARGEEAGPRADLYSLGVVTYQLMSGRLPYEANSLSELTIKQQREPPTPLDELNAQVPHAWPWPWPARWPSTRTTAPEDALELADMLRDGARGIAPPGGASVPHRAATRFIEREDEATAATRLTPRPAPRTAQTRAARPVEARRPPRRVEPNSAPRLRLPSLRPRTAVVFGVAWRCWCWPSSCSSWSSWPLRSPTALQTR